MVVGQITTDASAGCSDDVPNELSLYRAIDLQAPHAECSCECGIPQGTTCESMLYCYEDNACGEEIAGTPVGPVCEPVVLGGSTGQVVTTCLAMPPSPVGGACTAVGGASVPGYTWQPNALACFRDGGGSCDDSRTCVPNDPGDPERSCVAHAGDLVCPQGYSQRLLYEDGTVVDTRGCDGCECSAPTDAQCACSGTGPCAVQLFANGCNGSNPVQVPADGQSCRSVSFADGSGTDARLIGASVSRDGECSAATPSPVGGVTPAGTITVCCTG